MKLVGKRFAVEFADEFGGVFDRVNADVALDPVVVGIAVISLLEFRDEILDRRDGR